jgi:hypothetical protein
MLSWSAIETNHDLDIGTIVTPGADPGIPGGRELVDLGVASVGTTRDDSAVAAVAAILGPRPALKAACVAGAFEIYNRVVDATGLPTAAAMRRELKSLVDTLDLGGFPHAAH